MSAGDSSRPSWTEGSATYGYSVEGGAYSANYQLRALADGKHTVQVTQTEKAGNVS